MYLINAATKKLEYFKDERSAPPYAILSHTWGPSETTLQDLRAVEKLPWNTSTHLPGYSKINGTCEQALQDGIAYVWIDTCCIDKTSSAELDMSINSMFKWYRHAKVCYAYLDDVLVGTQSPPRNGKILDIAENDLVKSRWFTRGWTLQELIAPSHVEFFSAAWIPLGEKTDMLTLLERITGIHADALKGTPLDHFSIAERMSWASRRVTSVIEDVAYCLIGIFDVNLPLIYGERDKAFLRLQETIMKDSNDQSLFAWSPPHVPEGDEGHGPDDYWRGTSIFASHPTCFSASACMQPVLNDPSTQDTFFALTNRGVRMDLLNQQFTLPCPNPKQLKVRLVFLDCTYRGKPSSRVGIVVQQFDTDHPAQWTRHRGADLVVCNTELSGTTKAERSTVYLSKKLPQWSTYDLVAAEGECMTKANEQGHAQCRDYGVHHSAGKALSCTCVRFAISLSIACVVGVLLGWLPRELEVWLRVGSLTIVCYLLLSCLLGWQLAVIS